MKVEITENKVFVPGEDGKDKPLPKGTVLDIKGDTMPSPLVGKARIVSSPEGKEITVALDMDALRARYEELYGRKPDPKSKMETLQRAIAEGEAKLAEEHKKQLEDLRTKYFEVTGKVPADNLDAAALTAVLADLAK